MTIKKIMVILIFCCFTEYTLCNPADDVQTNSTESSSMEKISDELILFFYPRLKHDAVYYLNNAVNISEHILKDKSLIGNNNTIMVYEFKQNLTDFVDKYYNLYFEDITAFLELTVLYSSTTSYYYEIPSEQLTAETNLIVSLLKNYGSEQLNMEYQGLFLNNLEEYGKIIQRHNLTDKLTKKFFEYLHTFKTDMSFDYQVRGMTQSLYLGDYTNAVLRKSEKETKPNEKDIFQSAVKDLKQITIDYVNNAVNISELVINDPILAIDTSPVIQEFKSNITEFILNYYKSKQEYELLVKFADLYTGWNSHYYYQIANETATRDAKLIVSLLEKYGSIQLYEEYNKLLQEFVDKIQDKLLRKKNKSYAV